MQVVILKDAAAVAEYGANVFKQQLKKKPTSVLGLATGSSPIELYKNLIAANKAGDISFGQASSFNLDEYLGLEGTHPQSYRYFMNEQLFQHLDIDLARTHVPDGMAKNPEAACAEFEARMKDAGGVDLQLLGIGRNGHIGFNEPSSSLASRTRVKTLTKETIDDNARFFKEGEFQPNLSITMGIGTIMEAKQIVLIATGASKAQAIKDTVEGPLSAACPASILQMHPKAIVVIDEAAAASLIQREFYQYIETQNQKLQQEYYGA